MTGQQDYLIANPFARHSVGAEEIWDETEQPLCDVSDIHHEAFTRLTADLNEVRHDRHTRVRFLVGSAGSGKSHLFARLRRALRNDHFLLASNPHSDPALLKRAVLKSVTQGLNHPAIVDSLHLGYTQMERFVYALLQRVERFKRLPIEDIHGNWIQVHRKHYARLFEELDRSLQRIPSLDLPLAVRRALFRTLDEEKRGVAMEWLSGSETMPPEAYSFLKVAGPLEDLHVMDILKNLGRLGPICGPLVLILDQLDHLDRPEQIKEIESLLIDLKDHSRCWYVIVSLVERKFDLWRSLLSEPFIGRFGNLREGYWSLDPVELRPIERAQQAELVRSRLALPALVELRRRDGRKDGLFPFDAGHIEMLTGEAFQTPRVVLQEAQELFRKVILGHAIPRRELSDILAEELEHAAAFTGNDPAVDTGLVADRIGELVTVLSVSLKKAFPVSQDGPLSHGPRMFRGADREYTVGDVTLRIVCHDIQQGSAFPTVLKSVVEADHTIILVRDARVAISGSTTRALLKQFTQTNTFVHLPLADVRTLHALGGVLAAMREGKFANDRCDPAPTEENILKCIADMESVATMELTEVLCGFIEGKRRTGRFKDKVEDKGIPRPPLSLVEAVRDILSREGWVSFERLFYFTYQRGFPDLTREQLRSALASETIGNSVEIHPADPRFPEQIKILIWREG